MHSRIHKRDGFSFTEIAIVILILGILSAVAVPRFQESLSRASLDAACKRLLRILNSLVPMRSPNRPPLPLNFGSLQ